MTNIFPSNGGEFHGDVPNPMVESEKNDRLNKQKMGTMYINSTSTTSTF